MKTTTEERRLFDRINRRLKRCGQRLRKTNHWELGPFYVTNDRNCVVASGIGDLSQYLDELNREDAQ